MVGLSTDLEPGGHRATDVSRIRQERDMLLAMLEHIPTQVAYLDPDFNFVWVNAAYARGSGHGREELIGRNHFALYPHPENRALFERVRETGQPAEFRAKPFECADQPERGTTYSDWTLTPVHDAGGHVQGLLLSLLDVTERQRAEQARGDVRIASAYDELAWLVPPNDGALESLRDSEERFRAVAQSASDAIITIDRHGIIVFWNRAAETMFGYTPQEAIGQPLAFSMPERLRAAHQDAVERLVATGEPRILGETVKMIGLRKGGNEFPVELSLSTWSLREEVFFTGILRDITERARAEAEIESLARFPSENRFPVMRALQDGTICYANAASASLLAAWASQVGHTLPAALRQLVAEAIDCGASRSTEVTDGERTFSLDVVPIPQAGYANLYGRDITEQVQAEALLREQNQFIVNALEALNHPFCVIDANDYSVKMANSAAGGDSLPESVTCYALTHRRDDPCGTNGCVCPLEEVKVTRKPVIVEHVHYSRDGERRTYEVHAHPVFDSGGKVTQVIEYTLDITERKWWEEALQRERDFIAAVLDTAGALVVVLDPEGRIVRFNRACERLTGYLFDEVQGQRFWDMFLVPEEVEPVRAVFGELSAGQLPSTHENVWVARDGSRRSIAWSNTALVDGAGRVEYVIGTGIDVTERRRAEEALRQARDELELRVQERTRELQEANRVLEIESAGHRQTAETLRESEERYRRLVELSFQGILIHRDGRLVSINPAGATLLGAAHPGELVGTPLRDLFHPAYWDSVQARVQQGVADGTGVLLDEEKLLRLDGTSVDVEVAAVPVSYQGQPAVQVVLRDLTAHKQAELERERIARDLHDSLGHSLGYLHLKLDQLAASEGLDDVTVLRREVARMRDVASQAYEMVRGMLATLHPSNATDLATGLLVMARAAGQRADFEVQLSSEGRTRALHPIVQQQALYLFREALNNVVKHASAGHVDIHLSWGESALTITLADDGCGFAVGELVPEGHYGLGMMQERAHEVNGQLTFRSRPGAGTQVALRVPLPPRSQRVTEW